MSKFATYIASPTYDTLVEAIKVYLNRYDGDTVEAIPFFINAAEKTILRNLRMPAMEKMVSFNVAEIGDIESGFIAMPRDYLEMKFLWMEGNHATTFQRVTFDQLINEDNTELPYPYTPAIRPVWAINASRLYIRGVDYNTNIFMTYYADVPEISSVQTGNILLDLAPDAFLYLAVGEGFKFLMEEDKSSYWSKQGFDRLNQIKQQVADAEFSGSPLVISPY